jgi:DNA-binding MarR family transcriptional regulator
MAGRPELSPEVQRRRLVVASVLSVVLIAGSFTALVATCEGLPAGLAVSSEAFVSELARRRLGYGRSPRMKCAISSSSTSVFDRSFMPGIARRTCERRGSSSGGITYVVDKLAAKGLVERRPCPEDRRASYAALTPEGEALLDRIFPEHVRCLERALSGLPEQEQRQAAELLKKLGHMAAVLPPCGGE